MENDLEIIKKIREKEDQEDKLTEELRNRLKAELEALLKKNESDIQETRKKLQDSHNSSIAEISSKMEKLRQEKLKEAESKADAIKLKLSEEDLKDLVKKVLREYLEA